MMAKPMLIPTSTHWGNFNVETQNGQIVAIHPAEHDTQPSPIGQSLLASQDAGCRIPRPCIRAGWLKQLGRSDGAKRGVEPFVAVLWTRRVVRILYTRYSSAKNVGHGNQVWI